MSPSGQISLLILIHKSNNSCSMSAFQFVQVVVGGFPYSLAISDIEKYPGSFFECMIKKEWMKDDKPIAIDRDGALFKYVYSFLVTGHLPRDKVGVISIDDETLAKLKEEADFFGLGALVKECQIGQKKTSTYLEGYMTIRKYLESARRSTETWDVQYSSKLVRALKGVWSPFCLTGQIHKQSLTYKTIKLFQTSTVVDLKLDELIAAATQSPFGRGIETVTDTTVRNSFEISASKLDQEGLNLIKSSFGIENFAPHLELEIRPYKLVIYKEGGHFDAHRDTVRGEGHIGTLVFILNSAYTGGELEVSHNGHTEVVTGAYSWVAMYGDCLHRINPVTSGTRVSLIFDIYGTAPAQSSRAAGENDDEDSDEEEENHLDYYETPVGAFWDAQHMSVPRATVAKVHSVDAQLKQDITTSVDAELLSCDSLVITLSHLYPECQTSPAFLKGGDRALYDLLSEQYDVSVVAATIYRTHDPDCREYDNTTCSLFSTAEVNRTLGIKGDDASDGEESDVAQEAPGKKRRLQQGRTKLLIPGQFDGAGLLDYTPYIEHTGNESQAENTVYIVAGLQVQKRD